MTELTNLLTQGGFALMLVIARVGGAMLLLPGLGEAAAPAMVRAGLALGFALLLLPGLVDTMPPPPETGMQGALMIGAEAVTGIWFGWLARLVALALPVAAQFIAYLLGLSSVLQPDAQLGPQSTALARLFDLAAPLAVLSSDLYQLPLEALTGLYRLVPAGTLLPSADGALTAMEMMSQMFGLALRLAAPFVLATVVWNVVIGLFSRLVPRLQIYFIALPGQIVAGFLLLAVLVGAILAAWEIAARGLFASLPGTG